MVLYVIAVGIALVDFVFTKTWHCTVINDTHFCNNPKVHLSSVGIRSLDHIKVCNVSVHSPSIRREGNVLSKQHIVCTRVLPHADVIHRVCSLFTDKTDSLTG